MRFPLHIATDMAKWQVQNKVAGNDRYPIVLMLEPLYTCNLACIGCTPERHTGKLKDRLSLEDCLRSVDECGAPVVSICGGEPTLYPEIVELIDGCIARKKQVILCTNGLELDKFYAKAKPHKRLLINVHLDGMRETHDMVCAREGVFDAAIAGIKEGLRRGYAVSTNTTVYRETSLEEIEELAALLTPMGVQGIRYAPSFFDNGFVMPERNGAIWVKSFFSLTVFFFFREVAVARGLAFTGRIWTNPVSCSAKTICAGVTSVFSRTRTVCMPCRDGDSCSSPHRFAFSQDMMS